MTLQMTRDSIGRGFPDAAAERLFNDHIGLADRLARRYSFGVGVDGAPLRDR